MAGSLGCSVAQQLVCIHHPVEASGLLTLPCAGRGQLSLRPADPRGQSFAASLKLELSSLLPKSYPSQSGGGAPTALSGVGWGLGQSLSAFSTGSPSWALVGTLLLH